MASEAVLQAVLVSSRSGRGILREVGLAQAAQWLALPWHWGLTQPAGDVGGAHAGYRIYPCADGIVAVAALEPHFAQRLCEAADLQFSHPTDMRKPEIHQGVARFLAARSCAQLMRLAQDRDIPCTPCPPKPPEPAGAIGSQPQAGRFSNAYFSVSTSPWPCKHIGRPQWLRA